MTQHHYLAKTWTDPRQSFRSSSVQGIGAFATAAIDKSEVIEVIGGEGMSDAEFETYRASHSRFNAVQIAEDLHLVEAVEVVRQRAGGSLNHSCDSNLWLADEVTLVARRPIAEGEELTVDYALFTADPYWLLEQPCRCGTAHCRHTVTGRDWQLERVQAQYYPFFSPFINARIDTLRREKNT